MSFKDRLAEKGNQLAQAARQDAYNSKFGQKIKDTSLGKELKPKPKLRQKYRPEDNTYRDLYDEPDQKRADRTEGKPFTYVYWMTASAFFGTQVVFWLLGGTLLSILHSFSATDHYGIIPSTIYLMTASNHTGLLWASCIFTAVIVSVLAFYWLWRNWKVQNLLYDTSDLNQYHDNARLTQPEEMVKQYEAVPDSGAHSKAVNVSAVIGHMMIDNKGINKITIPKRYERDTVDANTHEFHAEKSLVLDADGKPIMETVPMFDKKFANTLFDSAELPSLKDPVGKRVRHWYDATKLDYNSKHKFGKLKYDTLADLINNDWYMPDYEVQRPGGVYIVDSSPSNTMVLAMTRSGKGKNHTNWFSIPDSIFGLAGMATC